MSWIDVVALVLTVAFWGMVVIFVAGLLLDD